MLDVEAVVAVRVERAGALQVRRQVIATVRMERGHPFHRLYGLGVATVPGTGAPGGNELLGGVAEAQGGTGRIRARRVGAVPVVADGGVPDVAAARVGHASVEAIYPLRQPVRIA